MTIKAIETRYAGCRFRSRLEARWAVFFDTLEIPWEYEPEGYQTPHGPYLPDFRLTLGQPLNIPAWIRENTSHRKVFFEVKGEYLRNEPIDKRWRDVSGINGGLYVAYGLPRMGRSSIRSFCDDGFPNSSITEDQLYRVWPSGERDGREYFCECPHCWNINISQWGLMIDELPGHEYGDDILKGYGYEFSCCKNTYQPGGLMYHGGVKKIMRAYDTARSARFEYGETVLTPEQIRREKLEKRYYATWDITTCERCSHMGCEHGRPDAGGCDACRCPQFVESPELVKMAEEVFGE